VPAGARGEGEGASLFLDQRGDISSARRGKEGKNKDLSVCCSEKKARSP